MQVFESHSDFLNDELFENYSLKYLKQISEKVRQRLKEENIPEVPMVNKINITIYLFYFKLLKIEQILDCFP